jgi:type II secretion system protein N
VVSFLFFLLLTFPTDLLLQRVVAAIEQTAPLRVRYQTSQWSWSRGWVLENLTIAKTGATPVQFARLTLRPSFFRLLHGQPFPLTFAALLYGGNAKGTFRQTGDTVDVRFTLDRLLLEHVPFPNPGKPGRLAGNLTLNGTLRGERKDINSWSGSLSATLAEGSITAGSIAKFPVPALQAADARLQATLKDGRLEVSHLTLTADGVTAQLQGAIGLRSPLQWSTLDLRLTTTITGAPPPSLATLVSLLPAVPGGAGERRATITGTFAAPLMR